MAMFNEATLQIICAILIIFILYMITKRNKGKIAFGICLIMYAVVAVIGTCFTYFISGHSPQRTIVPIFAIATAIDLIGNITNRDVE